MNRFFVAAASAVAVLGTAFSSLFAATNVQFPNNSPVTFVAQVPTGWTSSEDANGNLDLGLPGQPLAVVLSVSDNAATAKLTTAAIAQAGIAAANGSVYKQVPTSISGLNGTALFYSSKDSNGDTLDGKLTVIVIGARYIAIENVVTPTTVTPALQASIQSVVKGISLHVAK
jgi:hypothetical protein